MAAPALSPANKWRAENFGVFVLGFYCCLSAMFCPLLVRLFCSALNPITSFYRGKLRSVARGGFLLPAPQRRRGCCITFCYLLWLSIACELIVFARFLNGRYNTAEKITAHYLFDSSQTDISSLWPKDLVVTYQQHEDGTGLLGINKPLPYTFSLPNAITQNLDDLSYVLDLKYNYYFNPSDYSTQKSKRAQRSSDRLILDPIIRFESTDDADDINAADQESNGGIELLYILNHQQRSTVVIGGVLELEEFENHMNPVWSFIQLMCMKRGKEYTCTKNHVMQMSTLVAQELTTTRSAMFGSFVLIWMLII